MQNILLIDMPFEDIRSPSLALGLLKPILRNRGFCCEVAYLNVAFAHCAPTREIHHAIAGQRLLGDWVFAEALFGSSAPPEEGSFPSDCDMFFADPGRQFFVPDQHRDELSALRAAAASFVDDCMNAFNWKSYAVVGFSSRFTQQVASLALARRIKLEHPSVLVIMGGSNCRGELGPTILRLFPFIDWVFDGEADESLPAALACHDSGLPPRGVPGVSFRIEEEILTQGPGSSSELDDLPLPDYDDYFAAIKRWPVLDSTSVRLPLEFSRGCWWRNKCPCFFCGMNGELAEFRCKSPSRAEEELDNITRKHGIYRVCLTDSIVEPTYFDNLFPRIAARCNLDNLFLECRADVTREQIRILREAGVRVFQPGIESLDTSVLADMNKGTTLAQNVETLKWAREHGISAGWHLLCNLPGEDVQAYERMAAVVPLITHLNPPLDMGAVGLQRSSAMLSWARAGGLQGVRAIADYSTIYPFREEALDELAFFFEHDNEPQAMNGHIAEALRNAMLKWWRAWKRIEPPLLAYTIREDGLLIYDSRPTSDTPVTTLRGAVAAIYLACLTHQSTATLRVCMANLEDRQIYVENAIPILEQLVVDKLMLADGERYVSLAISLDTFRQFNRSILADLIELTDDNLSFLPIE
jgi:ribosomal peptide maturation radical SAM protein 1